MSEVDFCKIGDTGQQYQHFCEHDDGSVIMLGWSNNPESFAEMVRLRPRWNNHTFLDRWKE